MAKVVKFCVIAGYIKCYLPSLKKVWLESRDPFQNFTPHEISSERLKLQSSNFLHGLAREVLVL